MTDQSQPDRQNGDGLLPCPFCGGPAIFKRPGNARQSCIIKCQDCGCKLETGEVFRQGTAWNTRATLPARDAAEGAVSPCPVCGINNNSPFPCEHKTAPPKPAPSAPGHTDLMVTPESIDAFMEKNPLPAPDAMREAQIRRNYADSATHAAIATACEVACAGGSAQDVVKALRERFSTPVPPADGAPEPFAWVVLSDVTGNTRMWTRNGDIAKAFAAKHLLKCVELYATPPVRGDRETAREIVTEWLGMFDPPPQIDFQQSEFLQGAIASALAIPRTALPVQPGAGERVSFPRHWLEKIRDGLFAMGKLPSGPLGDWAFLFREQLNDILSRQAPPSSSEGGQ